MKRKDFTRIACSLVLAGGVLAIPTAAAQRSRATRPTEVLLLDLSTQVSGRVLWQEPGSPAIRSRPIHGKQVILPLDDAGTYGLFVDADGFVPASASFVHDGSPGQYFLCLALEPGTDLAVTLSVPGGVLVDEVQVTFAPEELAALSEDERSHYLGVLQRTADPSHALSSSWASTVPAGSTPACTLTNVPASLAQVPLRITSKNARYLPSLVLASPPG